MSRTAIVETVLLKTKLVETAIVETVEIALYGVLTFMVHQSLGNGLVVVRRNNATRSAENFFPTMGTF